MAWKVERNGVWYLIDRNPRFCERMGAISEKDAEVLRKRFEVKKADDLNQEGEFGRVTKEVFEEFIQHCVSQNRTPKTIHSYRVACLPFLETVPRIKQLTPEAVKKWAVHLKTTKSKHGKPYKKDTVLHRLRNIKVFCRWLVTEKILKISPFQIPISEGRKDAGRALSRAQVKALLDNWPTPDQSIKAKQTKLFFEIKFHGGFRLTELLGDTKFPDDYPGLLYENIDRENGILKLENTKNGEPREVPIYKPIVDRIPLGVGPVFRGKISYGVLTDHLAIAASNAGITGRLRVHDARVTSATEWARKNPDTKSAMEQFGWKSEKMAMHYNKVATAERIAQAQKISYE